MRDRKWKHTYTETDFHACLLLFGWTGGIEYQDSYWQSIDRWFERQWPDRWDKQRLGIPPAYAHKRPDYAGQMEFKIQFFGWVRDIYRDGTYVTPPDRIIPRKPYTAV